jgi:hypothetical protein
MTALIKNIKLSGEIVEATSENEAALKTLGSHLDAIILYMTPEEKKKCRMKMTVSPGKITEELQFLHVNYKIIYEHDANSVLLVQTKPHVLGKLTYNLREPFRITPSQDTVNFFRFEARRIGENIYEVIQKYTLLENQSTILMSYSPKLR